MPPKAVAPGSPEEWLARAKSNLVMASFPKPEDGLWEDWCFEAHQAVEKALKAVYQKRGLLFEFTHDIGELGIGLERGGLKIPTEIREAISLTKYAYETRYPGPLEHVTETEYRKALAIAKAAVKWAEKIIQSSDDSQGPMLHEPPAAYGMRRPTRKNSKGAGRKASGGLSLKAYRKKRKA
ncbi:MAG TPA: HEPN domain-containing protein [bacterium]|nr:HEPN domain-containing protein [bacterium]